MPRPATLAGCTHLPENRSALLALQNLVGQQHLDPAGAKPLLFFLHGPTGTGKTHLLEAFANELAALSIPVQIISAASFRLGPDAAGSTSAHLQSLVEQAREAKVLAIEDLHHLPLAAAEIVIALLDHRQSSGAPTLLTANQGPQQLGHRGEKFPRRLQSRLAGGLVMHNAPWQSASRLKYLQVLAARRQLAFPTPILSWLADHVQGGGRPLEGALEQLAALNQWCNPLTLATLKEHFQAQVQASRVNLPRIVRQVSRRFQIAEGHLQSTRRTSTILWARQVSMYLARKLTNLSLDKIGCYFGGRDHATVMHACRKVKQVLQADPLRAGQVHLLQAELT